MAIRSIDEFRTAGPVDRCVAVEEYARNAGFSRFEVAPIENDFWRFYVLRP